eukprot:Transcript_22302.p1 GENE.Transcript_22302~~Transcript_22302.p1  ORF type:complete len:400 (+),score=144.70 Transcript_22302:133-1332(+)
MRRTRSLRPGSAKSAGASASGNQDSVERVLAQLKAEQTALESQMRDLLTLQRPTEVQNAQYVKLKANHTQVLDRQVALQKSLLDLADQVRQSKEVHDHVQSMRVNDAQRAQQRAAAMGSSLEVMAARQREEAEALEWARADSLRQSRAPPQRRPEDDFEEQLRRATEESLRSAPVPPPHPDHDEVAEALRQSEWMAAQAAQAGEAQDAEAVRRAEAASLRDSRAEEEELRRAQAASLSERPPEDDELQRALAESQQAAEAEATAQREREEAELRRALQLSRESSGAGEAEPPRAPDQPAAAAAEQEDEELRRALEASLAAEQGLKEALEASLAEAAAAGLAPQSRAPPPPPPPPMEMPAAFPTSLAGGLPPAARDAVPPSSQPEEDFDLADLHVPVMRC